MTGDRQEQKQKRTNQYIKSINEKNQTKTNERTTIYSALVSAKYIC